MSHAEGQVILGDKIVGYYEYDGSADFAFPNFYPTWDEVVKNWRRHDNWRKCECGQPPTTIVLYTEYGGGFHWPSEACLACGAITGERHAMEVDAIDGHPLGNDFDTEWARMCKGEVGLRIPFRG